MGAITLALAGCHDSCALAASRYAGKPRADTHRTCAEPHAGRRAGLSLASRDIAQVAMVIDTEAHPSAILHRIGLPKPVGIGVGADFTELRIPLRPHHARCIRLVQAALTLGRGHGWIDVPRSQPRLV